MSIVKHTPGNWEVGLSLSGKIAVWNPQETGGNICCLTGLDEKDKANAKLIAAAPELLEELRKVYAMLMSEPEAEFFYDMEKISAAIKKATE